MEILKMYPENPTKKQMYDLTCNPNNQKMSLCEGQTLEIAAWCRYVDADAKNGEARELFSIQTPEGEVYATNSPTVWREFERMVDMFGPDGVTAIQVTSGTSKNGRKFFTVAYAGE